MNNTIGKALIWVIGFVAVFYLIRLMLLDNHKHKERMAGLDSEEKAKDRDLLKSTENKNFIRRIMEKAMELAGTVCPNLLLQ